MPEPEGRPDYALLDAVSQQIFYPRPDVSKPVGASIDLDLCMPDGVELRARFHPRSEPGPVILLFHGNGEVVGDYDEIAGDYLAAGAGLAVVDFRGYGQSGGTPLLSVVVSDAVHAARALIDELARRGQTGPWFAMGRSLGTYCALQVAVHLRDWLAGLIVESGSGDLVRVAQLAGLDLEQEDVAELLRAHDAQLASIDLPYLAIHGELDQMIPVDSARALLERLPTAHKHLEVLTGAGHNDLWWLGRNRYFAALSQFLQRAT